MVNFMKPLAKVGLQIAKIKPIGKLMTKASKNKPEIMAISGGVAVLTAFGLAIKAGMEVKERMEISAAKVEELEKKQTEALSVEDLTEEQKAAIIKACNKDIKMARADGVWEVAKLFLLPGGLLVVGLTLIGGGHHILKKRNVVLGAAASGWEKLYKNLAKNVEEAEGKEALMKYERGVVGEKEIETVIKGDDGKEKTVKQKIPIVKEQKGNPWRFEFSETYFDSYEDDIDRNLFFLKCEEEWWDKQLDRYGEVSMYEVLKHLGYKFDVLKASCKDMAEYRERMTFLRNYGWRKGCGDGFVDFGLYRAINEPAITRKTDICFLEFNCAGNLANLTSRDYTK